MREFFNSPTGKISSVVLFVAAMIVAYFVLHDSNQVVATANRRMFVDSTTLQPFPHELIMGESVPVEAPSGQRTGWPAEVCLWTAEGTKSDTPTYVLLNEFAGKPGPTFCPVCHRLVVGHNPVPQAGKKPPLTEAEWKRAHAP